MNIRTPVSQVDPQRTVQTFIDLIQRHEQSFYHFVHKVHSKGENLFNDLMRWVELFLTVIREGLGSPISLEFLLPHSGDERKAILEEVDAVALYHYKSKLAYESKIRRRFENSRGGAGGQDASAEDEAAQVFVQGFIQDFSMGELMRGDAEDVAAEETDEDSYGTSSEYESGTDDSDEDDDDEDDDEESEEAPRGMTRSRTMVHTRTPSQPRMPMTAPATSTSGPRPSRPPAQSGSSSRQESLSRKSSRPRLLSLPLRKSRSMTFSANGHSGGSSPSGVVRHSVDVPPPVPPLPKDAMRLARMNSVNTEKPLPAPPTPPSSSRLSDPNNNHRFPPPKVPSPQGNNNGGGRQRRESVTASMASSRRPASAGKKQKQKQKQQQQQDALKHPELKKVPELLPIFLEMVRVLFIFFTVV